MLREVIVPAFGANVLPSITPVEYSIAKTIYGVDEKAIGKFAVFDVLTANPHCLLTNSKPCRLVLRVTIIESCNRKTCQCFVGKA